MWPNIEYKLVLLKMGNPPVRIKTLKIDIGETEKTWRKKTYYYTSDDISYRDKRKYLIYKDIDNGNTILRWGKRDAPIDPEEPGSKTFKGLIRQALASMGGEYGLALVLIVGIAGIVGGFLLGASPLGQYFHGNQTVATATKMVFGVA